MKLIVGTDKEIKTLTPREIRNFVGSVIDNKYKDKIFWHKNLPPELIFVKPYKYGFEIVSWTNNAELLFVIEEAIKNKTINVRGIEAKVKKVWYKDESLTLPQQGLYFYRTRTPIILSTNEIEYKIVYATNTNNQEDLIKYIKRRIKQQTIYHLKHYYNIDISKTFKNLNLIIEQKDIRLVEYKEGEKKFQAVFLKMASNYSLPRFTGYKIGFGWGELIEGRM